MEEKLDIPTYLPTYLTYLWNVAFYLRNWYKTTEEEASA